MVHKVIIVSVRVRYVGFQVFGFRVFRFSGFQVFRFSVNVGGMGRGAQQFYFS